MTRCRPSISRSDEFAREPTNVRKQISRCNTLLFDIPGCTNPTSMLFRRHRILVNQVWISQHGREAKAFKFLAIFTSKLDVQTHSFKKEMLINFRLKHQD